MKKLLSIVVCLVMGMTMLMAQTKTVTGIVTSAEDGEPIIGASVVVTGTSTGTTTDFDGNFSLKVPQNAKTLTVSFVGMVTQTVTISNKAMRIELSANNEVLDEVMVVAYGTQKKSAFTGSAAVVSSEEIGKVQVTNAVDALKGKASGVQIYSGTGQPGATSTIRIRGFNSILAGQSPLIVLDGSPYEGSLNDINPIDVESMTVLKDAASTALYGARGGNGVILITTKNAKKGRDAQITVDAKWGRNSKGTQDYDRINNPQAYYELYYKGLNNYAQDKLGYDQGRAWKWANANLIDRAGGFGLGYNVYTIPEGQAMIGANGKLNPGATLGAYYENNGQIYYMQPDNWDDEIYHTSMRQEYTVSATGATDKSSFYASANYLNQEGIVYNSNYERFTGRLKADYQLKKWIKLGGNVSYSHFTRNYLSNEGASNTGNVFALHNIAPIYPVYVRDANGNIIMHPTAGIKTYDYGDGQYFPFTRPYLGQANPISDLLVDTQENEGNTINAGANIDITLPYGFTFTSINSSYVHENRYTSVTNPYFGQYASSNGIVSKEHDRSWSLNYQQRLNWHKTFGKHDVEVMVGHEYFRSRDYSLDYYMTNMFSQQNKELAGAVVGGTGSSSMGDYNTESWLSRAMYNYDEKYFGSLSVMRQGSSVFHPDHCWGTFWSFGAGWLINKEKWFNVEWVDELKLKASYGENGNDGIGSYLYTNRYSIENSNNSVSLVPSTTRKNEEITWEKNAKFNAGFDFSLFKGRLNGSAEYYANKTVDMMSSFPYAPSFGYTSSYANIGNMTNSGFEIEVRGEVMRTKDFSWNVYANITSNHNEITKLAEERKTQQCDGYLGYSSGSYFYTEGKSRYTYYTKKFAGIDETGQSLFYKNVYETETDGTPKKDDKGIYILKEITTTTNYSEADNYLYGDILPKFYGGFGTSASFKGFDLSVDFQYQIGGKIYDSEYQSLMGFDAGYGFHKDMLKAWSPENTSSLIPRIQVKDSYMASSTDRWLTDASYLSLANVTFGYTVPKTVCRKLGIEKVRLYVVGDNLGVLTHRKGLDSRQSVTGGSSGTNYSSVRTISGGVSLTF